MTLILNKQNKIELRNDPDGDWFGTLSINKIMHEFSF